MFKINWNWKHNAPRLMVVALMLGAAALGLIDPATAGAAVLIGDVSLEKLQGELEAALKKHHDELKGFVEKANGEIAVAKTMSTETKGAIDKIVGDLNGIHEKFAALRQEVLSRTPEGAEGKDESLGGRVIKSDLVEQYQKGQRSGRVEFEGINLRTAIVNATGQNQPLVPAQRVPGIIMPAERRMMIRDLLPVGRTVSNMVEYAKENVFTNNAGPQYSSPNFENVTKPESGITFTLAYAPVRTLAHWIPVSKQVLDDAPMLQSYVNGRLLYGLALEEEEQLLSGDGTGANISGLLDSGNFTAYNRGQTGDTKVDTLRRAITQVALSEYQATAIVINPADWEEIELTKDTQGRYVVTRDPQGLLTPRIWGLPVVATNTITAGTFLCGAFDMAAQVWDRQQMAVEMSREDGDNFKKNMVTLLAEERLALTVYRPAALVSGSY